MDRWPGAYPASEPPTPAPETPQQAQQQPQYPEQPAQRHPQGLAEQPSAQSVSNQALARDQQTRLPAQDQLTRENKQHDTLVHPHTTSGVGLSNAEYHRLQARTLGDERSPSVDEAVGGGTYARTVEDTTSHKDVKTSTLLNQLDQQPQRDFQQHEQTGKTAKHEQTGNVAWPLSNVSVQHEQQARELPQFQEGQNKQEAHNSQPGHGVHQYKPDHGHQDIYESQEQPRRIEQNLHEPQQQRHNIEEQPLKTHQYPAAGVQREVREVQQQPQGLPQHSRAVQQDSRESGPSHGHQPSDLPVAYQQHARAVPQQPHTTQQSAHALPDQSRNLHQQTQGVAGLSHGHQPSDLPVEYQQRTSEIPHRQHELRHESRELGQQPHNNQHSSKSSHSPTSSTKQSGTPPYWGSLPTAATGGIYNTVTGHGSPRDDHDHHHSLPQKDRSTDNITGPDASIPTARTSLPTGGVYNTVTGHGSGNEPASRHQSGSDKTHDTTFSRVPFAAAGVHSGPDDTGSSGPLSGVQSRNVQHSAGSSAPLSSTTAPSSTAHQGQTHLAERSNYGETGTQRAFPLTTSDKDAHTQDKSHSNAEKGLAAGALAGAGVAAYQYGKHDNDGARDAQGYAPTGAEQRATQAQPTSHHTHGHSEQKRSSPDSSEKPKKEHHGLFGFGSKHDKPEERDTRETSSHRHPPTAPEQRTTQAQPVDTKHTGKEHHGLFATSGQHDKDVHRAARDVSPVPGHPSSSEHRLVEPQSQAQPISPPNAQEKHKEHRGLFGLGGKHGNDEGREATDIAPIPGTHPAGVDHRATEQPKSLSPSSSEARRTSLDSRDRSSTDSPKRKGSVLGGIFGRHKDDKAEEEPKHQHQHRRSDSIERRKLHKDPPAAVAQAMRQSTPPKNNSIEEDRHRQTGVVGGALPSHRETHDRDVQNVNPSSGVYTSTANDPATAAPATRHAEQYDENKQRGHQGALATGAGLAAGGLAASELAHRHGESKDTSRQPDVNETASRGNAQSGAYNTLADGTPSGVATSRAGGATNAHTTSSSAAPYDSTSVSTETGHKYEGIAAGGAGAAGLLAASRQRQDTEQYDNTRGSTNTATTGTNSWRSELPPTVHTTRATDTSATHNTARDSPVRETYVPASTTHNTAEPYNTHGSSSTTSAVAAAGAASSYAAANTSTHDARQDESVPRALKHSQETGDASDLPKPYNVLPSGTPSGVNIEYRRRSREVERQL